MPQTDPLSRPLAIIGPSGCGKSSVVDQLLRAGLVHLTPSWTDRPQRQTEIGLEHVYVSSQAFDEQVAAGFFLETIQPFDLPFRYGLPKVAFKPGQISVIMLRAFVLPLLSKHYPDAVVYQVEASKAFAAAQLAKRDEAELGSRLSMFEQERELGRKLAQRIFINSGQPLEELVLQITEALTGDYQLHTL